jgi:DNA-binding NarL/FixJ family response regulator
MTRTKVSAASVIGVLIVETDSMRCQLMTAACKRSRYKLEVLACATDSETALRECEEQQPDVLTISAALRDGALKGLELIRQVKNIDPDVRTILLVESYENELILEAIRAGADGILCRDEPVETLWKCIRAVHEGLAWLRSAELRSIVEGLEENRAARLARSRGLEVLSGRQQEIVTHVSDGLSNREISRALHLSEHTVKNYLYRIFEKMGVSSRVELIVQVLNQKEPLELTGSD